MRSSTWIRWVVFSAVGISIALLNSPAAAQNHAPNPYTTVEGIWGKLGGDRTWGSTSAVFPAQDGSGNIWVAERCGQNSCVGKEDVPPVLLFDSDGNLLKSFGAGMFVWPHGIFVDSENNVWVTDARGGVGIGHQVHKFSEDGELLMSLGIAGVAGEGDGIFNQPSDVLVAPDGSIFVADGHGSRGNNRIVKLAPNGSFIKAWGETGQAAGQFRDPHALAMDSEGRLYVGDRGNARLQIFDQEGEYIATWTQFGRPSGLSSMPMTCSTAQTPSRTRPGEPTRAGSGASASAASGTADSYRPSSPIPLWTPITPERPARKAWPWMPWGTCTARRSDPACCGSTSSRGNRR